MILVVGATGDLGGRVVRLLRTAGADVRCLVRPGSDADALREIGAEVVPGDLVDAASLDRACRDVDLVIATATAMGRILAGRRHPTMHDVDVAGMGSLVHAAEAAGVSRFIYVSFAGIDHSLGSPLEEAKRTTESRLRASSMRATFVRPDAFQDIHLAPIGRFDIAAGKVAVFGKGQTARRYVSSQDVAALIAQVAQEEQSPDAIEFGGPEPLSKVEAVAIAEQLTGRRIKVRRMPRPLAMFIMRRLRRRSPAMASVFAAGLLQDVLPANWDDAPLWERGIVPRSVTEFLTEQAQRSGG